MQLENKTIVNTGGNSGIGFAAAKDIIEQGGAAIIVGCNQQRVDTAVKELGSKARGYVADVAKLSDIKHVFKKIKADHSTIDGLVANAGMGKVRPLSDVDEAHFDETFNINVKGAYFTARKALPLLKMAAALS